MSKPSLIARCTLSEQCLPDAPYRAMLCELHKDMLDEIDRLKAAQPAPCTWTKSADPHMPDTYAATCGAIWTFTEGGPAENNMRFCPE